MKWASQYECSELYIDAIDEINIFETFYTRTEVHKHHRFCLFSTEQDSTQVNNTRTRPLTMHQPNRQLPRICLSVYGPTDGSNVACDVTNHVALSGVHAGRRCQCNSCACLDKNRSFQIQITGM